MSSLLPISRVLFSGLPESRAPAHVTWEETNTNFESSPFFLLLPAVIPEHDIRWYEITISSAVSSPLLAHPQPAHGQVSVRNRKGLDAVQQQPKHWWVINTLLVTNTKQTPPTSCYEKS